MNNDSLSLFDRALLKSIKLDWNFIKFLQIGYSIEENLQNF